MLDKTEKSALLQKVHSMKKKEIRKWKNLNFSRKIRKRLFSKELLDKTKTFPLIEKIGKHITYFHCYMRKSDSTQFKKSVPAKTNYTIE